jgi:tRNA G26 N,N-dimethylase Trm1
MKKTDNHYLSEKIQLREEVISLVKNPKILECFSGKGVLYQNIKKDYQITRIEIEKGKNKNVHLQGDSYKYLIGMDLKKYNIIDLDAYGIPYKYIEHIVKSNFKGYVIVTAIQSGMGKMPEGLLKKLGYTKDMIKKYLQYLTQMDLVN